METRTRTRTKAAYHSMHSVAPHQDVSKLQNGRRETASAAKTIASVISAARLLKCDARRSEKKLAARPTAPATTE